jgi:NAD(P)-dependent dehydrogenase (short-subunit alcohol dehydrogenase family)
MVAYFNASTLAGKNIVVTGSAQGIGRAVSLAAARSGMRVVGLDVQTEAGESTAQRVREAGAEAWFYSCDVSDTVQLEQVFDAVETEVGSIDVLVNNAALVTHTAPEDLSPEEWAKIVGVNLTGMIFSAQHAGRSMIRSGRGGSIINLSSIGGIAALGRGNFAYSVTKAGIIGMTHELAVEWAGLGIRVNAVAPSQVHTEGFNLLIGDADIVGGDIATAAVAGIPLGRLAEAEDIASAVLFLAGPGASFITGVTLPVDGGSLALHAGGSLRPAVETSSSGVKK